MSTTVDPAGTTTVPAGGPAWATTWPVLDGFRALARSRRVVPVVRRLLADDVTPVGLYRTLAQGRPGTFVLESAESDGRWARFTRASASRPARPSRRATAGRCGRPTSPRASRARATWSRCWRRRSTCCARPRSTSLPPLTGGLAGAIGWDVIRHWEPTLPAHAPDELGVPELTLCLATDLAVVDHAEGSVWLVANAINFDDTDERVDEAYADAVRRLDAMQARLVAGGAHVASVVAADAVEPELEFRSTRDEFEASVVAGKDAIREGEVFQVVLSQRLDLDCPADPLDVYRALRTINPEPVHVLLPAHGRGRARLRGRRVEPGDAGQGRGRAGHDVPHRGLRPRGATPEEDVALGEELREDPKELAEHIMLVDLSRNDLVKVCEPTSVEVVEFMATKRSSHIMHLCSTVVGTLRDGATALDAFRATFPAGTLSGAPKPRAIALIDELEPASRGIYGGTAGYFDFDGNMDMAIAIRTALIRDGRASVQAGGGIVADSVPALEYAESRNKAAAAVRAVQVAARLRGLA